MLDNWLIEDINIINNFIKNFPIKPKQYIGGYYYYNGHSGYLEYSGGYYYSQHSGGPSYGNAYDNYQGGYTYTQYLNHIQYSQLTYTECGYQCEVNQYVKYYIGDFKFTNENEIYITAKQYNEVITYINKAKQIINNAIDKHANGLEKMSFSLSNVSISDIFYASTLNNINNSIQKFIDGATGIATKLQYEDKIPKSDLITFKETLNKIKIPDKISKGDIIKENE